MVGSMIKKIVKLILIGSEGSFNDGILIGTVLVNVVVRDAMHAARGVEGMLIFKTVICLDIPDGKRKPFAEKLKREGRRFIGDIRKNDGKLIPGKDINGGIFIDRRGEPGELRCDVFGIHLQIPQVSGIPWSHSMTILKQRATIPGRVGDQAFAGEESVDGSVRCRNPEDALELASTVVAFDSEGDNGLVEGQGNN